MFFGLQNYEKLPETKPIVPTNLWMLKNKP
jgi:hypothetical protein